MIQLSPIVDTASWQFGVTRQEILGRSRKAPIVAARHAVMFVLRSQGMTYEGIGSSLRMDHTSILHGCKAAFARSKRDAEYRKALSDLRKSAEVLS